MGKIKSLIDIGGDWMAAITKRNHLVYVKQILMVLGSVHFGGSQLNCPNAWVHCNVSDRMRAFMT